MLLLGLLLGYFQASKYKDMNEPHVLLSQYEPPTQVDILYTMLAASLGKPIGSTHDEKKVQCQFLT